MRVLLSSRSRSRIFVTDPSSGRRGTARGGGEGRAGREIGVDENFFCQLPCSPFPIPRLSSVALAKEDSPLPQNLGTDPTKGRKIKGLGGFWGGMGSDGVNLPLPILYRKWHTVGVTNCDSYRECSIVFLRCDTA